MCLGGVFNIKRRYLRRIAVISFRTMKVERLSAVILVIFCVAVASVRGIFEIRLPVGCPAAMNCTDIRFCGLDGFISKTPVDIPPERELYRMPLSDCRDPLINLEQGKCCRDPDYVDPWPSSTFRSIVTQRPKSGEDIISVPRVKRDCTYTTQRKYVSVRAGFFFIYKGVQ